MKNDTLFNVFAVFAGVVAFIVILSVILSITGCIQPRSETMCLKNNVWVQCPYNVPPRTDLTRH